MICRSMSWVRVRVHVTVCLCFGVKTNLGWMFRVALVKRLNWLNFLCLFMRCPIKVQTPPPSRKVTLVGSHLVFDCLWLPWLQTILHLRWMWETQTLVCYHFHQNYCLCSCMKKKKVAGISRSVQWKQFKQASQANSPAAVSCYPQLPSNWRAQRKQTTFQSPFSAPISLVPPTYQATVCICTFPRVNIGCS